MPKVLSTYVYAGDSSLAGNITYTGENKFSGQNNPTISIIANEANGLYAPTCGLLENVEADSAVIITLSACPKINNLSFPLGDAIELNGDTLLANLEAQNARTIAAQDCALTAKSIGDILYSAYVDDRADVNYNFTGGTNAAAAAINTYLTTTYGVGVTLTAVKAELVALGGVITNNA